MPARSRASQLGTAASGLKRQRINAPARAAHRKAKVKELKRGTHSQQWRQTSPASPAAPAKRLQGPGATLGPMGALGDDVIVEVDLNISVMQQLKIMGVKELNQNALFRLMRKELYEPLKAYCITKINIWAPSDTDELRIALRTALTPAGGSQTNGFPLRVILNTRGIPYAGPVNNMPNSWLRHPAKHHRNVGRYGSNLNDPGAVKGWYSLILLNGRKKAAKLFSKAVKEAAKAIPTGIFGNRTAYNIARSLFAYRDK